MASITGSTVDTLTELWTWGTAYNTGAKTVRISNTDTANSLDFEVRTIVYPNGIEDTYATGTITAGNFQLIEFDRDLAQINLYVKSTTAGASAAFTVENYLTNPNIGLLQVFKDPLITGSLTKVTIVPKGWSNESSMNTVRQYVAAFGSSSTDGTVAGGNINSSTTTASAESFNGTTWSYIASMNTARSD